MKKNRIIFIIVLLLTITNVSAMEVVTCGGVDDVPYKLLQFVGNIIKIVKIGVPIILIIMGAIDFAKAMSASDEKVMSDSIKKLVKRVVYAILVFFVVAIVQFVFGLLEDKNDSFSCASCMLGNDCNVTVLNVGTEKPSSSKSKKVTKIKITDKKKTMTEGETFRLKVEVTPKKATNRKVNYKSSKESVARISYDGVITAIKKGKTTITVTSQDNKKAKATFKLEVKEKPKKKSNNNSTETPSCTPSGKASQYILVGDSRTVQMYEFLTGEWGTQKVKKLESGYKKDDVLWSCKGGEGLNWMKSTGIPNIENKITSGTALLILMGVNDRGNVNNYIKYINEKASSWQQKGATVYFVSVGPARKGLTQNKSIDDFNKKMKEKLNSSINYLDLNSYLKSNGYQMQKAGNNRYDDFHYDGETSKKIYNYIKSNAGTGASCSSRGQEIVQYALQFVEKPYSYGGYWNGELPYTSTDCSGFVGGVYKHFGYSLPRTSHDQSTVGTKVNSVQEAQPGDLVFYGKTTVGHVAMYIGDGKIVHAKCSKCGIVTDNIDYSSNRKGIRRILK